MLHPDIIFFPVLLTLLVTLLVIVLLVSVQKKKLTLRGGFTALLLGMLVLTGTGFAGVLLLLAFFAMGVGATAHKRALKQQLKAGAAHSQQRNEWQVLANGGVAGVCALLAIIDPAHLSLYTAMLAGSLASATADTVSSELGTVYGKRSYNILSWKKEPAGPDGVISIEGTLAGIAGAAVIALVFGLMMGFDGRMPVILVAGITGNLVDSLLGASLERKGLIGNNFVNACNTAAGAMLAFLLLF